MQIGIIVFIIHIDINIQYSIWNRELEEEKKVAELRDRNSVTKQKITRLFYVIPNQGLMYSNIYWV